MECAAKIHSTSCETSADELPNFGCNMGGPKKNWPSALELTADISHGWSVAGKISLFTVWRGWRITSATKSWTYSPHRLTDRFALVGRKSAPKARFYGKELTIVGGLRPHSAKESMMCHHLV